jgi:hypothetical protein
MFNATKPIDLNCAIYAVDSLMGMFRGQPASNNILGEHQFLVLINLKY